MEISQERIGQIEKFIGTKFGELSAMILRADDENQKVKNAEDLERIKKGNEAMGATINDLGASKMDPIIAATAGDRIPDDDDPENFNDEKLRIYLELVIADVVLQCCDKDNKSRDFYSTTEFKSIAKFALILGKRFASDEIRGTRGHIGGDKCVLRRINRECEEFALKWATDRIMTILNLTVPQ